MQFSSQCARPILRENSRTVYTRAQVDSHISRSPPWTSKNVQNLTPAYESTLGRDLRLQAAVCNVRTGRLAVVERPAACRQRRHAATATRDDAMETAGGPRAIGESTPPAKSVAPCLSASACPQQTRCHPPSPSSTRLAGVWPAFRNNYQPSTCIGSPGKVVDQMTTSV